MTVVRIRIKFYIVNANLTYVRTYVCVRTFTAVSVDIYSICLFIIFIRKVGSLSRIYFLPGLLRFVKLYLISKCQLSGRNARVVDCYISKLQVHFS